MKNNIVFNLRRTINIHEMKYTSKVAAHRHIVPFLNLLIWLVLTTKKIHFGCNMKINLYVVIVNNQIVSTY
jgi:hypothetical protein